MSSRPALYWFMVHSLMQAAGMISHPGEMADFIEKAANELSWPDAAIPRWLSLELG